jgi:hypothetical protein
VIFLAAALMAARTMDRRVPARTLVPGE